MSLAVRPEDVHLCASDEAASDNVVRGTVEAVVFLGEAKECEVKLGESLVRLRVHPTTVVERGQQIHLSLTPDKCHALLS